MCNDFEKNVICDNMLCANNEYHPDLSIESMWSELLQAKSSEMKNKNKHLNSIQALKIFISVI